jgi:hypothetical protein
MLTLINTVVLDGTLIHAYLCMTSDESNVETKSHIMITFPHSLANIIFVIEIEEL